MRALPLLAFLAPLAACTPKDEPPGDSVADSEPPEESFDTGLYDQLNGERPAEFLAAPDFEAFAHTGEARGKEHLLGHPTVLWFYPLASTSG
jgi:hypothetical protein